MIEYPQRSPKKIMIAILDSKKALYILIIFQYSYTDNLCFTNIFYGKQYLNFELTRRN